MFKFSGHIAAALLLMTPALATAQQAPARSAWEGWIGCWSAAPNDALIAAPNNAPVVCITPAADVGPDFVDLTTIVAGKAVASDHIDASGREWAYDSKGCTGTQRATRSADGRRVYLKSSSSCNGIPTTTSAVLSMTSAGEWLDVRSVTAGGGENVRTARYHEVTVPIAVPKDIADVLAARDASAQAARSAAGAPINIDAVTEAARTVDAGVVEAWLLERGQAFPTLDARALVALSDAGLSPRVTDAMIAVSNPTAFAFARAEGAVAPLPTGNRTGQVIIATMEYDPWRYGYYNYDRYGYLYAPYNYGSGYGYGGYGYGSGNYGGYSTGYSAPIIIVNPSTAADAHGKLIKGRGYTQQGTTSTSGGSTGYVNTQGGSSSSSGSSTSSGSSAGSASTAPAQPATESRTAKPRP